MNETHAPSPAGAVDRQRVLDLHRQHVNRGFAKLAKFANLPIEVRSEGTHVFDQDGTRFLDCGGFSVFLLGHRHPAIVDAVKAQLDRHPMTTRVMLSPEVGEAAAALARVAPSGLEYVCFTNSGAEAVDVGIKLARINGRRRLIATEGGFHGKTLGALSVTGREHYQTPFQPLLPDVHFIPYGDAAALERALASGHGDAAVILEPIQGENGVVIPPPGYLSDARRLCSAANALLILDEIQTGLGRLGTWWGADREQVVPDILLCGKVLSGGVVPVGAAITTAALFEPFNNDPFLHTSTYAGNPLAMAAVRAAIDTIERERLVPAADRLGRRLLAALDEILKDRCSGLIAAVRGCGLLLGVEFHQAHIAADFIFELLQRKVIVSNSLNANRVARFTPPAVLSESDVSWLLDAVGGAAEALRKRYSQGS
jgi:putrescine aminotransferase